MHVLHLENNFITKDTSLQVYPFCALVTSSSTDHIFLKWSDLYLLFTLGPQKLQRCHVAPRAQASRLRRRYVYSQQGR